MPQARNRRSVRLPAFNYASHGAYFVTIVTTGRQCIFGDIVEGRLALTNIGEIVTSEWHRTAELRPYVELDEFIVMPNHVHGIVWLERDAGSQDHKTGTFQRPVAASLSTIIGLFKSEVTRKVKAKYGIDRVWQRGFYEHVIRSEKALAAIRQYTVDNPAAWAEDDENPANVRPR